MLEKSNSLHESKWLSAVVYGIFTLSGGCALVYQMAWVRRFSLEFGSTSLAVASVVAVFMGGLALGAIWGGRLGSMARKPLWLYGCIEITLALYAALSPWVFTWVLTLLGKVGVGIYDNSALLAGVRLFGAFLLIFPPTFLMGATLPLLSAWIARRVSSGTYGASALYSWNTVGATAGVVAGGFFLLPYLGFKWTLSSAAAVNLAFGLLCVLMGRSEVVDDSSGSKKIIDKKRSSGLAQVVLSEGVFLPGFSAVGTGALAVALAAAGSMGCQVIWTRVCTLVLGASVFSFTIVLATFLAGLSIGALLVTGWLKNRAAKAPQTFIGLLVTASLAVVITGYLFPYLPAWSVRLYQEMNIGADATKLFRMQFFLAAVLMLPPTVIFGGIFPAGLRALSIKGQSLSKEVGRLYAWNTAGSIVGVLGAGFFLLPMMGPSVSLVLSGGLFLFAALVSGLAFLEGKPRTAVAASVMVLGLFFAAASPDWDRQLMTSGPHTNVKLYKGMDSPEKLAEHLREEQEVLYYADGLFATIVVTEYKTGEAKGMLGISTDGKVDGSSHFDMPTQRLSAHLPILLHPQPQDICVIGMGTGCTAGSAALYPDVNVRVVEIERRMVEASRLFKDHNHAVHDRDNVEILVTDGRLHLLMKRQAYDVIISEPSNPWLAGSSDLFTSDFFQRAAGALKDGGVFAQWLQLYGMSDENVRLAIRGFLDAFPETYLVSTLPYVDILLIGAKQPIVFDFDHIRRRMANPAIRADMSDARVMVHSVFDLLARIRVTPDQLREMAGEGLRHTDDLPLLAYRAVRDRYRDTSEENEKMIAAYARGIGEKLVFNETDDRQLRVYYHLLADAYLRFVPESPEGFETRRLAGDDRRRLAPRH